MQIAAILNAFRTVGRTVNSNCLVSETFIVLRTGYIVVKRGTWVMMMMMMMMIIIIIIIIIMKQKSD